MIEAKTPIKKRSEKNIAVFDLNRGYFPRSRNFMRKTDLDRGQILIEENNPDRGKVPHCSVKNKEFIMAE